MCAIKDVFSNRIVGYSISDRMTAALAVSALRNAIGLRDHDGTIVHSDRGSQGTHLILYRSRLDDIGALALIGTVGDSYDNALADSTNGLYKTECVRHDGPFRTIDDPELATCSWVHWFNTNRSQNSLPHWGQIGLTNPTLSAGTRPSSTKTPTTITTTATSTS